MKVKELEKTHKAELKFAKAEKQRHTALVHLLYYICIDIRTCYLRVSIFLDSGILSSSSVTVSHTSISLQMLNYIGVSGT